MLLKDWTKEDLQAFSGEFHKGELQVQLSAAFKDLDGAWLAEAGKKEVLQHLMDFDSKTFIKLRAAAVVKALFGEEEKGTLAFLCWPSFRIAPALWATISVPQIS